MQAKLAYVGWTKSGVIRDLLTALLGVSTTCSHFPKEGPKATGPSPTILSIMATGNSSSVVVFTLSGLEGQTKENKYLLFSFTLLYYFLIVFTNLTLTVTILRERTLHEPMYFFLCNLCINGLYGTAGFYPKFLSDLLSDHHVISYAGCLLQVFVIYSSIPSDYSILAVMAFDRYLAICRPLEYHSIMTSQTVVKLVIFSWIPPFLCLTVAILLTHRLTLCGSHIDKLYCDNWSIVKLSCFSTMVNNVVGIVMMLVYFIIVLLIFLSYVKLIRTCLRSREARRKFMQTCFPHLLTLMNVHVAMLFDVMYSRYGSFYFQQNLRNFLALEYMIIPPLFNPLIYGIQLTKIRNAVLGNIKKHNSINV
ncbi:olfactory receptor 6C4-like [Megalops cyprinoides]|uniref:olfactory receptor 6C4-like n=1 Tax=Megalops cyprinoides TaxID=118141 RepID=UPI001864F70B|nr:olfactory receptor 6C4-like [Megalops cyprinoides]